MVASATCHPRPDHPTSHPTPPPATLELELARYVLTTASPTWHANLPELIQKVQSWVETATVIREEKSAGKEEGKITQREGGEGARHLAGGPGSTDDPLRDDRGV